MKILLPIDMGLGNAVLVTAFIKTLTQAYPGAEITILGNSKSPAWQLLSELPEVTSALTELDTQTYDICFLPFLGYHSKLLEKLWWKKKARQIISHSLQSPIFYKHALKTLYMYLNKLRGITYVPRDLTQHEIWNYLNLLMSLNLDKSHYRLSPSLPTSFIQKALNATHDHAIAHPFFVVQTVVSNGLKTPKNWPFEHWKKLLESQLTTSEYNAIIVGSPQEYAYSQQLIDSLEEPLKQRCINLCGKTSVLQLAGVLLKASFYVGADSGIAHLSAALNQKTIILWGPSPWVRCHPIGNRVTFINLEKTCSPCMGLFKRSDSEAYDLCLHKHDCMTGIQPSAVLTRIKALS